jgi:hypothetical protein
MKVTKRLDDGKKYEMKSRYEYWPQTIDVQLVSITTKVVGSNPAHGEVYSIQHYLITFVSDLRQVGGFLWILRFPPPIKLTT